MYLLGHVLEGLGEALLNKRKLSNSPNLGILRISVSIHAGVQANTDRAETYWLEILLDLAVESTGLECNDLRGSIGIVSDGRTALGAEKPPDRLARRALALPLLHGAIDGELVLGDNSDEC